MKNYAIIAHKTARDVFGVFGPSIPYRLSYFIIADGFVPDYFYSYLLGDSRQLVTRWFASSHHEKPWYRGTSANIKNPGCLTKQSHCHQRHQEDATINKSAGALDLES